MGSKWDGRPDHDPDVRRARGDAIRRELWGPQAGVRLEVLKRFEPDLADLVVREVFGTIYADDRLSLATRSLCTIACLIAPRAVPAGGEPHARCDADWRPD